MLAAPLVLTLPAPDTPCPPRILVSFPDGALTPISFCITQCDGAILCARAYVPHAHASSCTPRPATSSAYLTPCNTHPQDIYALGVMLYELLVGFTPVVAPVRRAAQHVAQPPAVVGPIASAAGSRGEIAAAAGSVSDFVTAEMSPATLHFPSSVSAPARAFITWALQADPRDRPTAKQLLLHPWIQTHLRA